MLKWKLFRSKWLAFFYLVFISILFFLPGSALPKENWFSKIYIDKWVHTGLFVALTFLWRSSVNIKGLHLFILAVIYGLIVEIVQREWIPNRDFDWFDLVFDAVGSSIGLFIWLRMNRKK